MPYRLVAAGIAGAGMLTAGLTGFSVLVGGVAPTTAVVCATSAPVAGLTDAQAGNARAVVATAQARAPSSASPLAVMVGLAESGLLVLANPADPASLALPHQGVGHDHDSVGIFQQRPGWGTVAQRMDPGQSTGLFLDALLALPDWQSDPPWVAAQRVQRSAYDGRPRPDNHFSSTVGGNYQAQWAEARRISAAVLASTQIGDCGGGAGDPPAGPRGPYGLPVSYRIPPGTSPAATAAITFALLQLGKPYVWGGAGPSSYDCSGLTMRAWEQGGVSLPHYARAQFTNGIPVTEPQLRPGDLVFVPGSDGTLTAPGHVGMFIGVGLVVLAPHTGDLVKVSTYASFTSSGLSGLRHYG